MTSAAALRAGAEGLAASLPPLLAAADQLARTVALGEHGRRRAGMGDDFWQYRMAAPGDPARSIDWRRSARSDQAFVQDKEWQIAQSVVLWVDPAASLRFASDADLPEKAVRARLIAMATALLLLRGGERVGIAGQIPPGRGRMQAERLAGALLAEAAGDHAAPDLTGLPPQSRGLIISDFMGDISGIEAALNLSVERGVAGAMVQVLDPAEAAFPFDGRTIFESVAGSMRHETLMAGGLRDRYLQRLAERQDYLARLARAAGWQFHTHLTDQAAAPGLLWVYRALEGGR